VATDALGVIKGVVVAARGDAHDTVRATISKSGYARIQRTWSHSRTLLFA
jgi:hypothetical protein